jgi:undecaprenyl-diphosphatase
MNLLKGAFFMSEHIIAFLMGCLEGLTEFLPVSSTGHLILLGHFLSFTGEKAKVFEVVIQLGAILAITVLYFKRYLSLLDFKHAKTQLNLLHVVLGMLPASIVGLIFHDFIKEHLFSEKTVIWGLFFGAILMIFADFRQKKTTTPQTDDLDKLTYKQALYIGIFQCLALYPGFSRSGSTMSGGMLSNVDKKTAADFSFFIGAPMMVAATGLDLLKSYKYLSMDDIGIFVIGFLTAFAVAMVSVITFLKVLKKIPFSYFAYYRIIVAVVLFFILF